MNILVVEDDNRVSDFLERGLRAAGYGVEVARHGIDGLQRALAADKLMQGDASIQYVLLLDVLLPGMNGLEICQTLRSQRVTMPILMLSALGSLVDRVAGLKLGADDYLPKPFAFEELLARIEALGRRASTTAATTNSRLEVDDLILDRSAMRVTRGGMSIVLTAKELALLELLMSAPGRLFSRERILANVWGVHEDPLTNVVDVFIRRLRGKIDFDSEVSFIQTVRGLGYRLESIKN